ncbi:hypothetical protein B5F53_12975 [Blautia sp. An249]|uniref:hypothetical protein n=1 Tax=Blautia sp. An249 TaxID=1965603 RepID=UPI000B3904C1|nr:hypothetical protein [Blautia sp. An249]OUO77748.1 hypothetical protein B5F53_12975 [Blautia sp. An249]
MSQKKVDANKLRKKNLTKEDKKERRDSILEKLFVAFLCIFAVSWIGYSVYVKVEEKSSQEITETAMDMTSIENYFNEMSVDAE